jgi:hypothetical protein
MFCGRISARNETDTTSAEATEEKNAPQRLQSDGQPFSHSLKFCYRMRLDIITEQTSSPSNARKYMQLNKETTHCSVTYDRPLRIPQRHELNVRNKEENFKMQQTNIQLVADQISMANCLVSWPSRAAESSRVRSGSRDVTSDFDPCQVAGKCPLGYRKSS